MDDDFDDGIDLQEFTDDDILDGDGDCDDGCDDFDGDDFDDEAPPHGPRCGCSECDNERKAYG